MEAPLVFTKYGNVPADTLDYKHEWKVSDEAIIFREWYELKTTGEIVKDSSHAYIPKGMLSEGQAAAL